MFGHIDEAGQEAGIVECWRVGKRHENGCQKRGDNRGQKARRYTSSEQRRRKNGQLRQKHEYRDHDMDVEHRLATRANAIAWIDLKQKLAEQRDPRRCGRCGYG